MVDGVLFDAFNLQTERFALRWKDQIRQAVQLKHYNTLSDEALVEENISLYPILSRTLSRGLDRSLVGDFFVKLGKRRMDGAFPISEVIYAINLVHKVVIEYIMTEYAPENPLRMYQSMGIMTQVAEFFLLACFYITKGFLEATYTHMNDNDKLSEELLQKYFKDDFFFKKE
jgi:hypothetical protein